MPLPIIDTNFIYTNEICDYCNTNPGLFRFTNSNKFCCERTSNKCPGIRLKNSKKLKEMHLNGEKGYTYNPSSNWSKGKTAYLDSRIKSSYSIDTMFIYDGKGPHKKVLILERGHKCESCKNDTWLDLPITLELEHIDGDSKNNIKENLLLLCPNCHSQTPTWRRRKDTGLKLGNAKYDDLTIINAIKSTKNINQCLQLLDLKWGSNKIIRRVMNQYSVDFNST